MSFIMNSLLEQIKKRRIALALKQHDMMLRVGISRQQYQRLESKGNPRLDTLELVAKGLKSELLLIPQEKLNAVLAVLDNDNLSSTEQGQMAKENSKSLSDDPWQGLLGQNE
jgi:transcriptional regulator with XRE-family HTH domain